jgi:S-adenosylmethionine decarboxylase
VEYGIAGRHYMADFYGVRKILLDDKEYLARVLSEAAVKCGATVLDDVAVKFEPNGVTVATVLSESHITCHTYPDQQFIAIDCYTCGENADPKVAVEYLAMLLAPRFADIQVARRGRLDFSEYLDKP